MKITPICFLVLFLSACNANEILASAPTRTPIQDSNPAHCPKWQAGSSPKITKNIRIPKGCAYDKVSFILSTSNVTFDCNNATLNGLGKSKRNTLYHRYKKNEAPRDTAFIIRGSEDNFLQNVTVKNCNIHYYINGFNVDFRLKKATHHTLKTQKNTKALENHLRTLSPKKIRIENNKIIDNHKSGIFLQRYITDLVAHKNTIRGAGDIGIYLESGTQRNTISHSTFSKNGRTSYNIRKRIRKLRFRQREAIAVDSSAYNIIKNNTFTDNAGGAIFIYKNCYERHQEARQLPRNQGSDFNIIKGNHFSNERKGIWIASRQSRELENFNCGDSTLLRTAGNGKYYEDFSKHNNITNNTFERTDIAIIIEDDHNILTNNRFKNTQSKDIILGTSADIHTVHPVKGTIIKNNHFSAKNSVWLRSNPIENVFSGNTPAISNR